MNYLKELKDEIKEVLAKDNLANIVISNTGFSAAFYVFAFTVPFNLLKGALSSFLAFLIYKRVSAVLK